MKQALLAARLSESEIEFCSLVASGMGNSSLAAAFGLTGDEVKRRREEIKGKIGASNPEIGLFEFLTEVE